MKFTDCANPKAQSVIPPRGNLEEEVIPCSNVHFYSSWYVSDLLPAEIVSAPDTAKAIAAARDQVGKQIRVLLPLEIEDVVNDYIFTFQVKDAALRPWSFADYLHSQP